MGVSGGDEVGAGEFRRYELSFFAAFTCYTVFPPNVCRNAKTNKGTWAHFVLGKLRH